MPSLEEESIQVLAPEDVKTESFSRSERERGVEEEERTVVVVPSREKGSEKLSEISEILRSADRLTVELYDAMIAETGSPEEMREIIKDLNALLELNEAKPCEPPCKYLDNLGDKGERGANQVYLLRLVERGRELAGVYKPLKGEERNALKAGIEDGSLYKREWLAFMVDRALDLGVVPPTVLRDEDMGLGSVQAFVKDADSALKEPLREKNPEDLVKVALLHKLTGQQDGHRGNILVSRGPKGETDAIDNGESFGAALYDATGKEVFPPLRVFSRALEEAKDISTAVQTPLLEIHLRKFLESPRRQESLKKAFDFVLGEEAEGVWGAFMKTAKDLLKKGQLPRDYDAKVARAEIKFGWSQEKHFGATTKREIAAAA